MAYGRVSYSLLLQRANSLRKYEETTRDKQSFFQKTWDMDRRFLVVEDFRHSHPMDHRRLLSLYAFSSLLVGRCSR